MSEIHLVNVKSYDNAFDANLAATKLKSFGIKAFVENENDMLNLNPVIKVLVSADDVFEALNILEDVKIIEEEEEEEE